MRTFEHFNQSGAPCPICGTNEDKPPVLIPLGGTEEGNFCQALQIHLDCIDLIAHRVCGKLLIGMSVDEKVSTNDLTKQNGS